MSLFERLDYIRDGKPDFILVAPPSLSRHREVEALKSILDERVASLDPKQQTPALLTEHLALEYSKLGEILFPDVPIESLRSGSRHRFFHAAPGTLSGLQRLLGYSLSSAPESSESAITVTSGDVVVDCLVDLGLAPYGQLLPWFTERYGVRDVLLLLTQTANRQLGQEAVNKIQSERDRQSWETIKASVDSERQQRGLDVMTMMGL